MDDGSGINLIFASTLRAINRSMTNLIPSDTSFHDIVPEKSFIPLGQIDLDVVFGGPPNFWSERLTFEVATGHHNTTPCWDDLRMHGSWLCRITLISS
jgi:hypothetical protein